MAILWRTGHIYRSPKPIVLGDRRSAGAIVGSANFPQAVSERAAVGWDSLDRPSVQGVEIIYSLIPDTVQTPASGVSAMQVSLLARPRNATITTGLPDGPVVPRASPECRPHRRLQALPWSTTSTILAPHQARRPSFTRACAVWHRSGGSPRLSSRTLPKECEGIASHAAMSSSGRAISARHSIWSDRGPWT